MSFEEKIALFEQQLTTPAIRDDEIRIPVRSGTETVAATRWTPDDGKTAHPTVFHITPYHKDGRISFGKYPWIRYFVEHGYNVVSADLVGTGASSGQIKEMFPPRERKDSAEAVEWLADQEWTNGRIGMYGISYGGITPLAAAAERPEGLEAIVPIHAPHTGYRNAYAEPKSGGLFDLFTIGMDWLTLMPAWDVLPPCYRDDDGRWAEVWKERLESVRNRDPWLIQFLKHEAKDEYWQDKDIAIDNIVTPTFAVGGWRDKYAYQTVEFYEAIDAPKRLLFGPWRHRNPYTGVESAIDFRRQVVEWFDHFLKQEETNALDHPNVVYWTERHGGGKVDDGVWRGRESWPDVRSVNTDQTVKFAFTPNGLQMASDYDSGDLIDEYEYDQTVGLYSLHPYGTDLAAMDTNPDDLRSLTYESEPLETPIELTGSGVAKVRVAASTPDPIISVRLIDVGPTGRATKVTHGELRANYRNGPSDPEPLKEGEEYVLEIPLKPKSHIFEQGHTLRIAVSAAYFPEYLPAPNQGSFTLRSAPSAPSSVEFPGQQRNELAFDDEVEMNPPDTSVPTSNPLEDYSYNTYEVSREHQSGRAVARKEKGSKLHFPQSEYTFEADYEAAVDPTDPRSMVSKNRVQITLDYGDQVAEIDAKTRITQENVQVSTVVEMDGQAIFDEEWLY